MVIEGQLCQIRLTTAQLRIVLQSTIEDKDHDSHVVLQHFKAVEHADHELRAVVFEDPQYTSSLAELLCRIDGLASSCKSCDLVDQYKEIDHHSQALIHQVAAIRTNGLLRLAFEESPIDDVRKYIEDSFALVVDEVDKPLRTVIEQAISHHLLLGVHRSASHERNKDLVEQHLRHTIFTLATLTALQETFDDQAVQLSAIKKELKSATKDAKEERELFSMQQQDYEDKLSKASEEIREFKEKSQAALRERAIAKSHAERSARELETMTNYRNLDRSLYDQLQGQHRALSETVVAYQEYYALQTADLDKVKTQIQDQEALETQNSSLIRDLEGAVNQLKELQTKWRRDAGIHANAKAILNSLGIDPETGKIIDAGGDPTCFSLARFLCLRAENGNLDRDLHDAREKIEGLENTIKQKGDEVSAVKTDIKQLELKRDQTSKQLEERAAALQATLMELDTCKDQVVQSKEIVRLRDLDIVDLRADLAVKNTELAAAKAAATEAEGLVESKTSAARGFFRKQKALAKEIEQKDEIIKEKDEQIARLTNMLADAAMKPHEEEEEEL
ncbi:hypothetical protein BDZ85DRAFT_261196 [Elsinoe ampelina]|uniref:Uncharacterized protein n=1 Tax=Elsinoe ampelina TaxID=302913 RepID=A0A6A6GFW9_9PEZI|nr:hypothetical protein BDZ85DRAFT_261196 [Elsinoe ampelina]